MLRLLPCNLCISLHRLEVGLGVRLSKKRHPLVLPNPNMLPLAASHRLWWIPVVITIQPTSVIQCPANHRQPGLLSKCHPHIAPVVCEVS
jgi:hypothetical protein